MTSLAVREYAEKLRSAREASRKVTRVPEKELLLSAATVARYRAPVAESVYPLEYAFHLLGNVNGKVILEYGCGDGLNTVALANRGARIIALDISAELLAISKRRLEVNGCDGVDLVLGSAHSLPLPRQSIDIVFGMAILHHLDLELAGSEIRRVLKQGGRGIFQEPIRNSKLLTRMRKLFPLRTEVSPFERPLTDKELEGFANLYTARARTFQLPLSSVAWSLPYVTKQAIALSAHVDTYLLRRFRRLAYYGTVKVFELMKGKGHTV